MEDNIIILEDQDGVQVEFETVDVFEFNGVTYFALMEVLPEEEENDEILIMQVRGEGDDMELVMVEDDEKLQAAFEEFCRRGASPDWICLYAEDDGKPVGLCFVELRRRTFMSDETSAYMHDIYVIPSSRRQHIGTMMYRIVEREAREKGAVRLDLSVWSFNEDAMSFYCKMGLTPQRYVLEKDIREEHFEHECEHMK